MGCEGIGARGNSESNDEGIDGPGETAIVIRSDEVKVEDLNLKLSKDEVLGSSKSGVAVDSKQKLSSCVIGMNKCEEFEHDLELGERVCRICHLSSDFDSLSEEATTTTNTTSCSKALDLINLGCGCKGELGTAHTHCAEAWFKLRGNRQCEICGETVKHIKGIGDNKFMEEWNDRTTRTTTSTALDIGDGSVGGGGCWRGQPFCNFLMACLVIAFVLPWFFRVNMF